MIWSDEMWPDGTKWKEDMPAIYTNIAFCYGVYFASSGLVYLWPKRKIEIKIHFNFNFYFFIIKSNDQFPSAVAVLLH